MGTIARADSLQRVMVGKRVVVLTTASVARELG